MEGARQPRDRSYADRNTRPQPVFRAAPAAGAAPRPAVPDVARQANDEQRVRKQSRSIWLQVHVPRRRTLGIAAVCLLVVSGIVWGWHSYQLAHQPPRNPFGPSTLASAGFPLYYPTQLPQGYHIDYRSVNVPQQGVVVFYMVGPKSQKLYMSEEARPSTFDLGGFYRRLTDLKEVVVSDGGIATGRTNNGLTEIASRANNKTWMLSNTNASIPMDQLSAMMKSLTLSH